MDLWMKVGSAMLLLAMIVYIWPRMRAVAESAPKGTAEDWRGLLWPLLAVVGFVMFLVSLVRQG